MKAPHQAQMTSAHVLSTKPYGTWRVNHNLLGDGNEMGSSHIHFLVMHQDLNNSDFFSNLQNVQFKPIKTHYFVNFCDSSGRRIMLAQTSQVHPNGLLT